MIRFFCIALGLAFVNLTARAAESFSEPWRPQFHFTPATNWMNDPNGLVFYEGEYHLFYQFNPFGTKWGHMSWGHAVSRDMVRWEHLPIALYEENDVMIFSGSAVVDWKNTSGFGKNGKPPLIAIYTGHYTKKPLQNQHIAYSNDRGRTWTKFSGNPVLDIGERDFRDPKVMWHEPIKRWVMTIAWCNERKVRFYSSPDLKTWTHLSDFGPAGATQGIWECPDLFPLPIESKSLVNRRSSFADQKWVLIVNLGSGAPAGGAGCQYFIGNFDGTKFTLDESHPKPQPEFVPQGKLLADFEGDDYSGWRATGDAFGNAPARGKIDGQQPVDGFRGRGLVNSFLNGDKTQGTLTSREFEVTHAFINFLIGGGNHAGKTCMNLLMDGRAVRTATGDAAEHLAWKSFDVREFRGRKATLQIVDDESGGWGHINVDHIFLANEPARAATQPVLWADHGRDFYAAVTWSDIPRSDDRRIFLGWMSSPEYAGDVPTAPWRCAMSLPRELALRETAAGLRMTQRPISELKKLRGTHHSYSPLSLTDASSWLVRQKFQSELLEVEAEFAMPPDAGEFSINILTATNELTTVHRTAEGKLLLDRTRSGVTNFHRKFSALHEAPLPARNGVVSLRLFLDTSSLEVFGNDGEVVITDLILPSSGPRTLSLSGTGDTPRVKRLDVWELKSAWR
jgi:sucrose-6-phosphate hydrolase SacC (GH32 family)